MSNKKAGPRHRSSHVRHRRPAREDPQRGARRPLRRGQDHAGRGAARGHRHDQPGRHDRRRHHGQRPRPGRGRPAALGAPVACAADPVRRRHGQPARHPRLRRLRRRAARRAARRRRGAVRGLGRRRDRPDHRRAVGGVRRGRHPARGGRSPGWTHPRADFDDAVARCQRRVRRTDEDVLPLYLPVRQRAGDDGARARAGRAAHPHRCSTTARAARRRCRADPQRPVAIGEPARRADRGDHQRTARTRR